MRTTRQDTRKKERRSHRRLSLADPLGARISNFVPARVTEISLGGMQVETTFRVCPKTPYKITIFFPPGPYTAWTTVSRRKASERRLDDGSDIVIVYRAALRFSEMPHASLAALSYNLIILAGESAHPARAALAIAQPTAALKSDLSPVRLLSAGRRVGHRVLSWTGRLGEVAPQPMN